MTIIPDRVPANRTSECRPPPAAPDRAGRERRSPGADRERRSPSADAVPRPPVVVSVGLPAPAPQIVQQARAYLTPRHATGVDGLLWQSRERPMPDRDAIDAVITAGERARHGTGDSPEPVEVAAALLVLSAVRLALDQTEARLLNTARAAGMGFEQIAAVLDLSVEEAEERHRQLEPRLDEPAAAPSPPPAGRTTARNAPLRRPRGDRPSWDESDDDDWGG
ncbi:hypothetical protein [Actinomadura opuntiae]|uniref:hypothetical protein n=1 Tax=Actinomadura sp. OS1-43 TaxID=604315 RepID=UPI00255A7C97|nr:hypothetical protein [Actinomadura sp. OS1-43]MDL4815263.1 hypothetical protein [Actinomadura sp. OS1-43]